VSADSAATPYLDTMTARPLPASIDDTLSLLTGAGYVFDRLLRPFTPIPQQLFPFS
jgi:hypothetical protein